MKALPEVGSSRSMVLIDCLTRTDIVRYAGASGEFTPVHFDESAAHALGYPTVFAQGMLVAGHLGRLLTDWFDVTEITQLGFRFKAQVWPGDSLTGHVSVVAIVDTPEGAQFDLALRTTNQQGVEVIHGTATAHVPRPDQAKAAAFPGRS